MNQADVKTLNTLMRSFLKQFSWEEWYYFVVVQLFSHVWLFVTPWTAACQASLSFTISQNSLKLMSVESMMPSSHLILSHCLLLLPSILPSIRVFSSESALCIKRPKYWSFSINPSNEYSGLISFRIYWRLGWSPCSPRDSPEVFSSATVWKHQFFGAQPCLLPNSHMCTSLLEKP